MSAGEAEFRRRFMALVQKRKEYLERGTKEELTTE